MTRDWIASVVRRAPVGDSALAWFIIVATIPTGLAGLVVSLLAGGMLRSALVIALANLVFAGLLWWSDVKGARCRELGAMRLRDAVLVGFAQALALIPGVSRSGVTMTAGLALGFSRQAAARFSFLLAVPIIVLAGLLETWELLSEPAPVDWAAMAAGVLVAALCAFACIHVFLRLVERVGMLPFVLYRLVLGVALLIFLV